MMLKNMIFDKKFGPSMHWYGTAINIIQFLNVGKVFKKFSLALENLFIVIIFLVLVCRVWPNEPKTLVVEQQQSQQHIP